MQGVGKMKIPVKLNGQDTMLDVPSGKMLLNVLRERGLLSVKCGCSGHAGGKARQICGACTVLLDGRPVPSCIVPIAIARDSSIITMEYFSQTAEYTDIINGFKTAGVTLCGFCDAGKIFQAEYILRTKTIEGAPARQAIYDTMSCLSPCCTSVARLCDGIIQAYNNRTDRTGVADRRSVAQNTRM